MLERHAAQRLADEELDVVARSDGRHPRDLVADALLGEIAGADSIWITGSRGAWGAGSPGDHGRREYGRTWADMGSPEPGRSPVDCFTCSAGVFLFRQQLNNDSQLT